MIRPDTASRKRRYVPAVGPRLQKLLAVVFGLFALLGANSLFLLSVTVAESLTGEVYQDWFYLVMFMLHLFLGALILVPFLFFGIVHWRNSYQRKNRRAVKVGYGLFTTGLLLLVSGLLLSRVELGGLLIGTRTPWFRTAAYWVHVVAPVVAAWLFVLHRLAGRRIRWRVGGTWAGVAAVFALLMLVVQTQDPRSWNTAGNPKGEEYFFPSLARTVSGDFIPARSLDNVDYCVECHEDVTRRWEHSVHRLASFNNPAYFASVRETRRVLFEREGTVQGARFCAGCHDPVPFFSGEFDEPRFDAPDYDLSEDPLGSAGITCTACHAISNINTPRGNADYTIDEPGQYPFAFSTNPTLKWVNRQLVKAKPEFHKKTFLKPLHRSTEFCGSCHKVHLPPELNGYKWLRGQNHFDSFWLSGVSGYGVSSFYYPEKAEPNCNGCHMPLRPSDDFGSADFAEDGTLAVHDHLFPSANTAIASLLGLPPMVIDEHRTFLQNTARVDLFGLRKEARIDGELLAPLSRDSPVMEPGESYLIEVVIRTLKMGHLLTEGTADSNQLWLELTVFESDRVIGGTGGLDFSGRVDPWSHFVNSYVLDRDGNRISRRNAQDIFVPLYSNQIPPGAADTVHFKFKVPEATHRPVRVVARLKYRKFDTEYLRFFTEDPDRVNDLPITVIAEDEYTFSIPRVPASPNEPSEIPGWERWNDYGIGLLRRGQFRQASRSFEEVERLRVVDGPLNLARVWIEEGQVQQQAQAALARAAAFAPPARPWTLLWLSGIVNAQNGQYAEAADKFRELVRGGFREASGRGFDFSRDYRLLNELAEALYQRALLQRGPSRADSRQGLLEEARELYLSALRLDPENLRAHWGLRQVYQQLGDVESERRHSEQHARFKPDDNARDHAIGQARRRDPAANAAAQRIPIYDLNRKEAYPVVRPQSQQRNP